MGHDERLPKFFSHSPEEWLVRTEAFFVDHEIKDDNVKYNKVLNALPADITPLLARVTRAAPTSGKYNAIKAEILRCCSKTTAQRAHALLDFPSATDRSPLVVDSDITNIIGNLSGEELSDAIRRACFLRSLGPRYRDLLSDSTLSYTKLVDKACSLYNDGCTTNHDSLATTPRSVDAIHRPRGRSSPTRTPSDPDSCWYHIKWGKEAKKCRGGTCKFQHLVGNDPAGH